MSTLKVAAINNPSASSGGLAISASGNVTGAGLDLITTQSFSAVSSVSINSCFSATYENYRVLLSLSSASTCDILCRMRASGSDTTTSTYNWAYSRGGRSTLSDGGAALADSKWIIHSTTTGYVSQYHLDIYRANTNGQVGMISQAFAYDGGYVITARGGNCTQATAHDGITVYTSTGTMTGSLRIYGHRNS